MKKVLLLGLCALGLMACNKDEKAAEQPAAPAAEAKPADAAPAGDAKPADAAPAADAKPAEAAPAAGEQAK